MVATGAIQLQQTTTPMFDTAFVLLIIAELVLSTYPLLLRH